VRWEIASEVCRKCNGKISIVYRRSMLISNNSRLKKGIKLNKSYQNMKRLSKVAYNYKALRKIKNNK